MNTSGSITSSGNPLTQQNPKNPFGTLAGIAAGYAGGETVQANSNVSGAVTVTNSAAVNVRLGDGILAFNVGNGSVSVANIGSVNAPTGIALAGGRAVQYTLTNNGNVTGGLTALDLTGIGGPATINQQGGAIVGNILLSPNGDTLNITGGTIAGNIVGDSAANGAKSGTVNLDGATFTTNGTIDVSRINVNSGTLVLANDVTVFDSLVNNAVVELASRNTRTINGTYAQTAGGTLLVAISPAGSAGLAVTGRASLNGTLELAYAPGSYTPQVYQVLTAAGGITGRFATTIATGFVPTALAGSVVYTPGSADLVLTGASSVVAPSDGSLFAAQNSALALLADETLSTLLGENEVPSCGGPALASQGTNPADPASTIPMCRSGGWMRAAYVPFQASSTGAEPGFSANVSKLMVGADWPLLEGRARLGVAAGYDEGWLSDDAGGSSRQQVARIATYGSARLGPVIVAAALGYGHDLNNTTRQTGIDVSSESHGGDEVDGGILVRLPIKVNDYALTPAIGLRLASFNERGFAETGSAASSSFAVSGGGMRFDSVVPNVGLKISHSIVTEDGLRVTPDGQIGYEYQAGAVSPSPTLTAANGTMFTNQGLRLARSSVVFDTGLSVSRGSWSVFGGLHARLASNWSSEAVQADVRLAF